jgi:GMP synthase-like glutamine amidotransferase
MMRHSPLKVAILINHPPNAHFYTEIQSAFTDSFTALNLCLDVSFFDPIEKGDYPDASKYDLVILSGGKADASASDPWIVTMLEYIRQVGDRGETKILGICWGHQALIRAFGGLVTAVPKGPVAGLVRVGLTPAGCAFFPSLAFKKSYVRTSPLSYSMFAVVCIV